MLFRILGLSNKHLARWAKVYGYFICLMGGACILVGLNSLDKNHAAKNEVLPYVNELAMALNNLNLETDKEKITVKYASKFLVMHSENSYKYGSYLGLIVVCFGMIFLFMGAVFFKLNILVNPSPNQ